MLRREDGQVELDEQLRTLLPNYVIHQVKEKFGGLRYYWEPGEELHDPSDPSGEAAVGGEAAIAERERHIELARKLVAGAEKRAAVTCELCGATGRPDERGLGLCVGFAILGVARGEGALQRHILARQHRVCAQPVTEVQAALELRAVIDQMKVMGAMVEPM
jgi:hypothetical protein